MLFIMAIILHTLRAWQARPNAKYICAKWILLQVGLLQRSRKMRARTKWTKTCKRFSSFTFNFLVASTVKSFLEALFHIIILIPVYVVALPFWLHSLLPLPNPKLIIILFPNSPQSISRYGIVGKNCENGSIAKIDPSLKNQKFHQILRFFELLITKINFLSTVII